MGDIVGEYQCGFRGGNGIVNQLYTLRKIQAKSYQDQEHTEIEFIDFKQAYD